VTSYRERQELDGKYPIPAWLRFVTAVMRPLLWPFRKWVWRTRVGRIGRVGWLEGEGRFREAFDLALESASLSLRPLRTARCAGNLGAVEQQRVIDLLASAPAPGGLARAEVLEQMSRWRWRDGDAAGAIDLARQALGADPTWPYGRITLAFYGLKSGLADPLPPLIEAVRSDPEALRHIESSFKESPELLTALRKAIPTA